MRYIAFIFLFTFATAQNNGIRSLNGSLNNSQRLTIDTTSSATFKWTISNGVHTVYIPYRIASMTSGSGSVGNADSLGGLPASYYLLKSDTAKIYAGYGLLKDSSNHTVTLRADTSILVNKAGTQVISSSKYFTADQYLRGRLFVGDAQSSVTEQAVVSSNTDADLSLWTASASDFSHFAGYRSRGTLTTPSDISTGDNVAQFRGFGRYSGSFTEIANFVIGDHSKATPSGFFSLKVKSENSASITTDTSVIIAFPYMEYGTVQNYGVWLGSKTTVMSTIPAGVTVNATFNTKWASSFDSVASFTRGINVGGSAFVDASRNISNAVAITATGLMTLGAGGTAQAHQISSNSANALTLYRPITSVGAASGLNFAGQTSNGTQVTYGTIQGLLQSASNSIQSGGLTFASRRAGTEVRAVIIDSMTNVGLQIQNTSTLSDTRFWIRSSGLSLYALSVIPAASNTKQFAVDTVGNPRVVSAVTTAGAFGLAPTVDTVTYAGVGSSIASKNLTATVGMYRLTYNIFCTTAGSAGTAQMTLTFNNGASQSLTSSAINLTSTTSKDDNVFTYYVASGTPTVAVTVAGATGSPVYSFHAIVERLK